MTKGLEAETDMLVIQPSGMGLVTEWLTADPWMFCYTQPVTTWGDCFTQPTTVWDDCFDQPITVWETCE